MDEEENTESAKTKLIGTEKTGGNEKEVHSVDIQTADSSKAANSQQSTSKLMDA